MLRISVRLMWLGPIRWADGIENGIGVPAQDIRDAVASQEYRERAEGKEPMGPPSGGPAPEALGRVTWICKERVRSKNEPSMMSFDASVGIGFLEYLCV